MRKETQKAIGIRLQELRNTKDLSQGDVADALNRLVGYGGVYSEPKHGTELTGENGRTTVSKYEHGKHIKIDTLIAYADIFNVSVDYLLGRIDSYQPEYKSIKEVTGLTDGALHSLNNMREYNREENVKNRIRLMGVTEDKLKANYENYKNQLKNQHNEEICILISRALLDEEFWRYFNDGINGIFKILKNSPDDTQNIEIEKNKITNRFGKLVDDCIEHFKKYSKNQKKLF